MLSENCKGSDSQECGEEATIWTTRKFSKVYSKTKKCVKISGYNFASSGLLKVIISDENINKVFH